MTRNGAQAPAATDSLEQLIETERELRARIEAAEAGAERLLSEARSRAAAVEENHREDLARQLERLERDLHEAAAAERCALEKEMARREARYTTLSPAQVDELARQVVGRVLSVDQSETVA